MTSKIEKIEGDSVVLRLSRAVDAKILAILAKMLEAVDSEKDDYIISPNNREWPDSFPCPSLPLTPAPTYPPGTVVCYGCGPVIYNPLFREGDFTVSCTSSLTVSSDNKK